MMRYNYQRQHFGQVNRGLPSATGIVGTAGCINEQERETALKQARLSMR
jgi:hypothetical protein